MYIYIYICIFACTHMTAAEQAHHVSCSRIYICNIYIHIITFKHMYMHISPHLYVHTYIQIYVCVHVYTYINILVYIYICIFIYIYM